MGVASGSTAPHSLGIAHSLYATASKDECWGGIFRIRHLKATVRSGPLPQGSAPPASSPSQADGKPGGDVAAPQDNGYDAPTTQDRVPGARTDAPLRRAVIAHARSLSRALCLFDVAVTDGGTTKAVVNGPVRARQEMISARVHRGGRYITWSDPPIHAPSLGLGAFLPVMLP